MLGAFNSQPFFTHADTSLVNIVSAQVVNSNGQRNLFFVRGVDTVGFKIAIANSGQTSVTGSIIITIQDVNGVPVQTVTCQNFTVPANSTNNIELFSGTIPTYAYVGIASAQINFVELPNIHRLLFRRNGKLLHKRCQKPARPFSHIIATPSLASVTAGTGTIYEVVGYDFIWKQH